MKNKKIIVIGAHPDDIEIGCGGTIKRFALQNAEIYFIVATRGTDNRYRIKFHNRTPRAI